MSDIKDECQFCHDDACPLDWMSHEGEQVLACKECFDELVLGKIPLTQVHFVGNGLPGMPYSDIQYHGIGEVHMLGRKRKGEE